MLDVLTGNVQGECRKEHKSKDFIGFLKKVDKDCEKGKMPHIILDNYSVHKSAETKGYLGKKGKQFMLHFIPAHLSRLNMAELRFAEIGSWNDEGRAFKCTKSADVILDKINRSKVHYNIA